MGFKLIQILMAALLISPMARAETSPQDYKERTEQHILRVTILGVAAVERFPRAFPEISSNLVYQYLSGFHDAPKLWPLEELRVYGYPFKKPVSSRLAQFYGVNRVLNNLPPWERLLLDQTIAELNRIEARHKQEFFDHHSLSREGQEQLEFLERAADLTDSGIARWSELGMSRDEALASVFLKQAAEEQALIDLVTWMENHYLYLIQDVPLEKLTCSPLLRSILH